VGYRIDYSVTGGVLMATVSGSSSPGAIARDLVREARHNAARDLLVDVRRLRDRVARLREVLASARLPKRIAVLDNARNERLYVFAELDAAHRGCTLRRFDDQEAALEWLWQLRGGR
jgi:hypothetical protein